MTCIMCSTNTFSLIFRIVRVKSVHNFRDIYWVDSDSWESRINSFFAIIGHEIVKKIRLTIN